MAGIEQASPTATAPLADATHNGAAGLTSTGAGAVMAVAPGYLTHLQTFRLPQGGFAPGGVVLDQQMAATLQAGIGDSVTLRARGRCAAALPRQWRGAGHQGRRPVPAAQSPDRSGRRAAAGEHRADAVVDVRAHLRPRVADSHCRQCRLERGSRRPERRPVAGSGATGAGHADWQPLERSGARHRGPQSSPAKPARPDPIRRQSRRPVEHGRRRRALRRGAVHHAGGSRRAGRPRSRLSGGARDRRAGPPRSGIAARPGRPAPGLDRRLAGRQPAGGVDCRPGRNGARRARGRHAGQRWRAPERRAGAGRWGGVRRARDPGCGRGEAGDRGADAQNLDRRRPSRRPARASGAVAPDRARFHRTPSSAA